MKTGLVRNRSGERYKPSVIRSYDGALKRHLLDELGGARLADVQRRYVPQVCPSDR